MQTSIYHLEEKAKKLLQLSGLGESVIALLPETVTKSGAKYNRVVISFKGDRLTAETTAKELLWWWWVCNDNRIGEEFDIYALEFDNQPEDSPVVYFFKDEQIFIEIEDGNEPASILGAGEEETIPTARLSLEEAVNKIIEEAGLSKQIEITLTNGKKAAEIMEVDFTDISELAILSFKDEDRKQAETAAKNLLWQKYTNDKEFQGYILLVENERFDMPIIYFYREPA